VAGMRGAPPLYRFLRRALPPVVMPYFRVEAEDVDRVPTEGPAVIAANHLSFVDSIVLALSLPRPLYYLGKADYWDSARTRWLVAGAGVVPVHREGGDRGDASLRAGVELLGRGQLLGIYPEGTRSPDGRLYRGKTGPVRMALEAGAPIVPVGIVGSDLAMPQDRRVIRRSPIRLRFGAPLDLSRYRDRREDPLVLRSATDELMYEIMRLSGQEYVDEYAAHVKSGDVDPDEALPLPPTGTLNALTEWDVARRPEETGPFDGDEGEGDGEVYIA
jgi:1-acyl-sn-glycerol-3-phosphate acyltransferase